MQSSKVDNSSINERKNGINNNGNNGVRLELNPVFCYAKCF